MPDDSEDRAAKLQAELERLKAEYGADAVKRFLKKSQRKKRPGGRRGRPVLVDEAALSSMADLLHLKQVKSEQKAAESVAATVDGASFEAKVHRLCRKFRKDREKLKAEAAERHRRPQFAVEALTGSRRTITAMRAEHGAPQDISEMRAEWERLFGFDGSFMEKEIAQRIAALQGDYARSIAAFERMQRQEAEQLQTAMAAFERMHDIDKARAAMAEMERADQELLRRIAFDPGWKHVLGYDD